ncbi:MAG: hypothetical protein U9Q69_05750 [Nanoarchaeota archaeon]|nr:hypothetical protein [Nanoarchaeota archaeon]
MKKIYLIIIGIIFLISIVILLHPEHLIGMNILDSSENEHHGIPPEELECMQNCVAVGCQRGDIACVASNQEKCMKQCNAGPSEALSQEEKCIQNCIGSFCIDGPEYASCMNVHLSECERECGMNKKPEAANEEEQCIMNCVAKIDSTIICGPSKEGESGNEVCQRCAQECLYLYKGPCLTDKQVNEKENECSSLCEHCYGEQVMGPSGEGWECIIDIKCKDASSEFGDEPGQGPAVSGNKMKVTEQVSETVGEQVSETVGNVFEAIGSFLDRIFDRNA